jgi:hypothetical protein
MFELFHRPPRLRVVVAALAAVALITSVTPAFSAVSPLKIAREALALAKKADRKATRALATSGEPGPAGADGAPGPKGDPGPVGLTGPKGETGTTGLSGAKGDPGTTGLLGADGLAGATGTGFRWRGEWTADVEYKEGDAVSFGGAAFITGVEGATTHERRSSTRATARAARRCCWTPARQCATRSGPSAPTAPKGPPCTSASQPRRQRMSWWSMPASTYTGPSALKPSAA